MDVRNIGRTGRKRNRKENGFTSMMDVLRSILLWLSLLLLLLLPFWLSSQLVHVHALFMIPLKLPILPLFPIDNSSGLKGLKIIIQNSANKSNSEQPINKGDPTPQTVSYQTPTIQLPLLLFQNQHLLIINLLFPTKKMPASAPLPHPLTLLQNFLSEYPERSDRREFQHCSQ